MLQITQLHLWVLQLERDEVTNILKVGDQKSATFYLGEVGTLKMALRGWEMLLYYTVRRTAV